MHVPELFLDLSLSSCISLLLITTSLFRSCCAVARISVLFVTSVLGGEEDALENRDKLRLTIITECTQTAGKILESEVMVIL